MTPTSDDAPAGVGTTTVVLPLTLDDEPAGEWDGGAAEREGDPDLAAAQEESALRCWGCGTKLSSEEEEARGLCKGCWQARIEVAGNDDGE